MAKPKKRKQWLKSLLAALLTALVVVGATLAPGFVLRLEQVAIPEGYYTLQQRGNRLDFNEMYYYAGAAISLQRYYGYMEPAPELEEQIMSYDIDLAEYFADMRHAGVVPEAFWEVIDFRDYYAPAVSVERLSVPPYDLMVVETSVGGYLGYYISPITTVVDENTKKPITISFELPEYRMIAEEASAEGTPFLEPYLKSYVAWLELENVSDWNVYGEWEMADRNYINLYLQWRSEEAGVTLTASITYDGYSETTRYYVDIQPNVQYYM